MLEWLILWLDDENESFEVALISSNVNPAMNENVDQNCYKFLKVFLCADLKHNVCDLSACLYTH